MNELERYIAVLHEIAIKNINKGTPNKVREEVKAMRRKFGLGKKIEKVAIEILREETQKLQLEFVKEMYSPVQNMAVESVKNAEKSIPDKIITLVRKELSKNSDSADILRKLSKNAGVEEHHLQTVYTTVSMSLSRSQGFLDAKKAGVEQWKYAGRTGGNIRPFCAENVGKVYTLDQIKNLDNGQGLSVQFFCGGYNCTHRWMPVF